MEDNFEEICKELLAWARRRLDALDKMETRLNEMRELALYAASHAMNEQETAQVQERINILHAEVHELDKATALVENSQLN